MSTKSLLLSLPSVKSGSFIPMIKSDGGADPILATAHNIFGYFCLFHVDRLLRVSIHYSHVISTGAGVGAGNCTFSLPGGFDIDYGALTTLTTTASSGLGGTALGNCSAVSQNNQGLGTVFAIPNNRLVVAVPSTGVVSQIPSLISNVWYPITLSNYSLNIIADVPVL